MGQHAFAALAILLATPGAGSLLSATTPVSTNLPEQPQQAPPTRPPPPETPAPDPSSDPVLNDPSIDDALLEMKSRAGAAGRIAPSANAPNLTGIPATPPDSTIRAVRMGVPGARVLPEGTFVAAQQGLLTKLANGDLAFSPDDPDNTPIVGLLLLRCQRTAQLATSLADSGGTARATLSGQIFVYRQRPYLLPSVFSIQPEASAQPSNAPAQNPAALDPSRLQSRPSDPDAPDAPTTGEPRDSAAARIRELDAMDAGVRALSRPRPGGVAAPRRPSAELAPDDRTSRARGRGAEMLIPDGTVVTARRGRLVRAGRGGELAFSVDSDPDSPGTPPMTLLPCRLLESIEASAAQHGENMAFLVSGRVTVFQGRNYLLPTMYKTLRTSDVVPHQ